MKYSRSLKQSVLKKIYPPESRSVRSVSREMGISEQTIRKWKAVGESSRLGPATDEKSPRYYSDLEKYQMVMEGLRLSEEELGRFLREKGLHSEHLTLWDQELREMVKRKKTQKDLEMRSIIQENKALKKDLARKEKALAEMGALLVLKKKFETLMEEPGDA